MIYKDLFINDNIQQKHLNLGLAKKLSKRFNKIILEIREDLKNPTKTINVLDSKFKINFKMNDLSKFKKYKTVVIIGMGGSILGAEAIFEFFKKKIKKKIYFFNDLNENKIKEFKKKKNSKTLFIIISKSGNTIETFTNTFLLNILKMNAKNLILISEKKNNLLFSLSKKLNLFYIEHKKNIGGRYSVLSEVGLLPAYLMGININKLRLNILDHLKKKHLNQLKKNTIKFASMMNFRKINNLIFLNYFPELEKFLFWCQQLIAESLGKKKRGFLPVISNVPKDHHSLMQLYLDGPKDKLFYIFSNDFKLSEIVQIDKSFGITSYLNKKNFALIKKAQKNALIKTFIKKNIPFREFRIKKNNEQTLGKLFSLFILEVIIVGKMLNLNPFDQPAVEQVKVYTRKLLK